MVAQALLEKAISHRSELRPGARPARRQPHLRGPYGLGGDGDGAADRRARGAGGDPCRQRGSLGALRARRVSICSTAGSTIRIAEFELALRLNPNFSPARGYLWRGAGLSRPLGGGRSRRAQALRASPRDPFAAIYCGVAAYSQFVGRNYDEAIRLAREALRQRGDFVGAHRVPHRRRRDGRPPTTSPRPR